MTTHDRVYYLDVSEADSHRKSFDLNAYSAGLDMEALQPVLMNVSRHYRISDKEIHNLVDRVRHHRFGHLSGGIGRDGRGFLTFYFGIEPVVSG